MNLLPVRKTQCKTCPFCEDGWTEVRELLEKRALMEASPICHCTGDSLPESKGKPFICCGARDFQIQFFHRIGFIDEATDEAWNAKLLEMKNKSTTVKS